MNAHFINHIHEIAAAKRLPEPVYVTRPNLPPLETLMDVLRPAWEKQWITNDGSLHVQLETALKSFFNVPHIDLFCNGTVALLAALKALRLEHGEVITTPFTFPATVNVLDWCGLKPVFCDIRSVDHNMDPDLIEELISPETRALLPVHVYGTPCDVERIDAIARRHNLPVVYDAAHAFGVRVHGKSILSYGTMSMLSFHATKVFTTAEGGAVATNSSELHGQLRLLKNFGIVNEETVIASGINGKMSEMHAALGLTQLDSIEKNTDVRKRLSKLYRERLSIIPGIATPETADHVAHNYAYFPIRVRRNEYGMDRDTLYTLLKEFNIFSRKYFYPLCSSQSWRQTTPCALPQAEAAAQEILCLPIYVALAESAVAEICDIIAAVGAVARS